MATTDKMSVALGSPARLSWPGWGPPGERDIDMIRRDLGRGYITAEAAIADYGVKIEAGQVRRHI